MGRKWTKTDVLAYNIQVVYQDLTAFFGVTELPPPDVKDDALTAQNNASATDRSTACMLIHLNRLKDTDNRRFATIDFVRGLFDVLHYRNVEKMRFPIFGPPLHFIAKGSPPQLDVCVTDNSFTTSLVVKVDRRSRGFDPEPRLISDAIGAFNNDNIIRVERLGTKPIANKVMPGIVMDGSMPTFYKIPITTELVGAVEAGKRPEQETVVHAYRPEVPRPEEGMNLLENRYIILSCFEAFRRFIF